MTIICDQIFCLQLGLTEPVPDFQNAASSFCFAID